MNLNFTVHGDKQLAVSFGKKANQIKNFKPAFEEIQSDFYETERDLFATEGGTGGKGRWTPLVPWYAKWKEKEGRGETILVLSGNLYSSLVNKDDKDSIAVVDENHMELGTKNPLGIIHYANKKKPRRPIDLGDKDKKRWIKIMQRFIQWVLKGNYGVGEVGKYI